MASLAPIYTTKPGVLTFSGEVSLLQTPEAQSLLEYQVGSFFDVQVLELTALLQSMLVTALRTRRIPTWFPCR